MKRKRKKEQTSFLRILVHIGIVRRGGLAVCNKGFPKKRERARQREPGRESSRHESHRKQARLVAKTGVNCLECPGGLQD